MKKLLVILMPLTILLILAGIVIPIDSKITGTCGGPLINVEMEKVRLDMIKGERLPDTPANNDEEGCSPVTKYELYLL